MSLLFSQEADPILCVCLGPAHLPLQETQVQHPESHSKKVQPIYCPGTPISMSEDRSFQGSVLVLFSYRRCK